MVDGVGNGQLGDATPCDEWDVRALIDHVVTTVTTFAIAAEKGHVPDTDARTLAGDLVGADVRTAWKGASERLLRAFERPEVLQTVLVLPSGDTPGDVALDLAVLEVGIHAADLARATRHDVADQAPFGEVMAILRARMTDAWRVPGILDDAQPVPSRAEPVDALLAYAGRRAG